MEEALTYRKAGVDIDKGNRFVERIKQITKEAPNYWLD